jgi:ABC-type nitrate/sulfonate/bicarbonate transport system permease component
MQRVANLALPATGILLFLCVWQVAGWLLGDTVLAPPTEVLSNYVTLLAQGDMLRELVLSLRQMAVGYVAACVIGMPVGVAMGRSRVADAIFHPWVAMFVVTSTAAMIPLLILFLGTGIWLRITVVFLATVFYIILTTYNGARGINPNQLAVGRSFGAGQLQIFWKIMLPSLYPYLLAGARIGLVHAIRAMVMAELFVIVGYGGLIHQTGLDISTAPLLGLLLTLMIVSLLLDFVLRSVGRWAAPWYEQQRLPGFGR